MSFILNMNQKIDLNLIYILTTLFVISKMPNHVANHVIIKGDFDVLKKFWNIATTKTKNNSRGQFCYENLYPVPKDENWYSWCIENWGNKWGCYDVVEKKIDIENNIIELYYDTAWSPSEPFWCKITKKYNFEVTNYFHDEGSCFCGHHVYNNGNVSSREEHINYQNEEDIFKRYAHICGRDKWYDSDDYSSDEGDESDNSKVMNQMKNNNIFFCVKKYIIIIIINI
ncbi:hypothetical protein QJ854_gp381 [Moumouvirus goulette]|uniref:YubB ferredoxin-like domain-containing protein n=1 Tax=Moumouvirus goulette TaxID=1247379 RepID=M1PN39_9VIRU|nr:hypothetical protein QJ854_gp381 [Moumouvirus goulette]AGF85401.1 hypothetical protein glt_00592 [Moumouvirus goulette]